MSESPPATPQIQDSDDDELLRDEEEENGNVNHGLGGGGGGGGGGDKDEVAEVIVDVDDDDDDDDDEDDDGDGGDEDEDEDEVVVEMDDDDDDDDDDDRIVKDKFKSTKHDRSKDVKSKQEQGNEKEKEMDIDMETEREKEKKKDRKDRREKKKKSSDDEEEEEEDDDDEAPPRTTKKIHTDMVKERPTKKKSINISSDEDDDQHDLSDIEKIKHPKNVQAKQKDNDKDNHNHNDKKSNKEKIGTSDNAAAAAAEDDDEEEDEGDDDDDIISKKKSKDYSEKARASGQDSFSDADLDALIPRKAKPKKKSLANIADDFSGSEDSHRPEKNNKNKKHQALSESGNESDDVPRGRDPDRINDFAEKTSDVDLDDEEPEEFPEYREAPMVRFNITSMPNDDCVIAKLPNVLGCEPTAFDVDTFEDNENMSEKIQGSDSIIRWKFKPGKTVKDIMESENFQDVAYSNCNFVEWSDGSKTLMIGNESYDVTMQDVVPQSTLQIFLRFPNGQMAQRRLNHRMRIVPTTMKSVAHKSLAALASSKANKGRKLIMIDTTVDPEKEEEKNLQKQMELDREHKRREAARRRKAEQQIQKNDYSRRRDMARYIEDRFNDSDEEAEDDDYETVKSSMKRSYEQVSKRKEDPGKLEAVKEKEKAPVIRYKRKVTRVEDSDEDEDFDSD